MIATGSRVSWALIAVACGAQLGCDDKADDRGAVPPPIASSKPGACAAGGGEVKDPAARAFVPRKAGAYCIDPNNPDRSFGADAPLPLDKACTSLLDGECENYKRYGLERIVNLRYLDGKGSPGSVAVNISRFATAEGAYGFFTERTVGEADPAKSTASPLAAGGAGALGSGIAYVWRGRYLVEASYTNELEAPDQLKSSSQRVLPFIVTGIGAKLEGSKQAPVAVLALPTEQRVPLGVKLARGDMLSVKGAGPGAVGYYQAGAKRFRVVAQIRADDAAAKDSFGTLSRLPGVKKLEGMPFDGIEFSLREDDEAPLVGWVFGRKGSKIFGVGDEDLVLEAESPNDEKSKVSLKRGEKISRLRKLLE